jgi:DNA-binding GntR family transcriptional regulator
MREMTRVDAIYETLRDRICLGQYSPGDIFHETDLGQEFKVSRTPIRQVLQRLAYEKLAVVRTGVGTIVEGYPDSMVRNYLELHARMLSTVSELGLTEEPADREELIAALHFRASRLSADADPERVWRLLKALQDLGNRLLGDDLLRHMDELLFYRSGPALMRGARAKPGLAVKILRKNIAAIADPLEDRDYPAFFAVQSDNTRRLQSLIGIDA